MGNSGNRPPAGNLGAIPLSTNDPYDDLYGEADAAKARARAPAQKRATINEEPNPYPPEAEDRVGQFSNYK